MNRNKHVALLSLRLLLGFIFFFQGYGKVVDIGVLELHDGMFAPQYAEVLPEWITLFTAYYTSYVELLGGALLILGLFRDWALYALVSVLVIVTFGHGLSEPIWDLSHVVFRTVLLIPLLLLPAEWDRFRLDTLVFRAK